MSITSCLFQVNISPLSYFNKVTPIDLNNGNFFRSWRNTPRTIFNYEKDRPAAIASLFYEDSSSRKVELCFNMSQYEDITMKIINVKKNVRQVELLEVNGAITDRRSNDLNEIKNVLNEKFVASEPIRRRRLLRPYIVDF